MRRLFWVTAGLGLGVAVAVLVARRFDQARQSLTPDAVAHRLGRVATTAGELASEVRAAAAAREAELRAALLHGEPADSSIGDAFRKVRQSRAAASGAGSVPGARATTAASRAAGGSDDIWADGEPLYDF